MKLQVKPSHQNNFPLSGMLIKGGSLLQWLQQLQQMNVDLQQVNVYAIPGTIANTVWGCFVNLSRKEATAATMDKYEPCQLVHGLLYIPQYSSLYPVMAATDLQALLKNVPHIYHPEFGWAMLDTVLDWENLLQPGTEIKPQFRKPVATVFIPSLIRSVQMQPANPDDVLDELEKKVVPERKDLEDKPLNILEKIKLFFLRLLLKPREQTNGTAPGKERTGILKYLEKLFPKLLTGESKWMKNMEQDLEQLEKRSQSEVDKLMELFKRNPEEALKYAIPLNETGMGRGQYGSFEMSRRWGGFDLFGSSGSSGGGSAVFSSDAYHTLAEKYNSTAVELVAANEHQKAAFIYLKLLKDYHLAAQTLRNGKLYAEAAAVYLKYTNNKIQAAECYEQARMTTEAIALYKDAGQHEKVGDLYASLQKISEAQTYYQAAVDEKISNNYFVKASQIFLHKMNDPAAAQEILLRGWRGSHKDSFNCIHEYFSNIKDPALLMQAMEEIYRKDVGTNNSAVFLRALSHEFKKGNELSVKSKEIAYEIVSQHATKHPDIVSELKDFNKDPVLIKDILRYKVSRR